MRFPEFLEVRRARAGEASVQSQTRCLLAKWGRIPTARDMVGRRDEAAEARATPPREAHMLEKQKFLNYIESHTRLKDDYLGQSIESAKTLRTGGRFYATSSNKSERKDFEQSLRSELQRIADGYTKTAVLDDTHFRNICVLSKDITNRCGNILEGNKFRIGPAQKALNLYLKYRWCEAPTFEPQHFPIDGVAIKDASTRFRDVRWTTLDNIDVYKQIIAELKKKHNSLADWELAFWNRKHIKPERAGLTEQ